VHLGTHFKVLVPEHFGNPRQLGVAVSGKANRQLVVKLDEHISLQPEDEVLVLPQRVGIVVQFELSIVPAGVVPVVEVPIVPKVVWSPEKQLILIGFAAVKSHFGIQLVAVLVSHKGNELQVAASPAFNLNIQSEVILFIHKFLHPLGLNAV